MNNITNGLLDAGHKVKVLTICTYKHPFNPNVLPEAYKKRTHIEGVYVNTRIDMIEAFSNLVTRDPYNISRFFSPDMDMKIIEVLKNSAPFDIIHLESLFMTPYIGTIRRFSDARIVLRSHNLEYLIWKRMANGAQNFAKRTYMKILGDQLKNYELEIMDQLDGIVAISEEDEKTYRELNCPVPLRNIPFGLELGDRYASIPSPETPLRLFHLGSMDWLPNEEGVNWFLEEVWPLIHRDHPRAELVLAGRNMPEYLLRAEHPHVKVVGEVDDALTFMQNNGIMVVPLLSAGGIRVKIIEGMALGKVIVSTPVGADGIRCEDGQHLLIAKGAEAFAHTVGKALEDETLRETLSSNARRLIKEEYNASKVTADLIAFYKELLDVKVPS